MSDVRTIKSFVRRKGKITKGQQNALNIASNEYLIPFQRTYLAKFPFSVPDQPLILEVGFGMGVSLATMAHQNAHLNYLGVEVHTAGVGNLIKLAVATDSQLPNLKIMEHDVIEVLESMIPDECLSGVQIFFPDPWHKKRHHKRRLISDHFLNLIAPKIMKGGFFHFATDWTPYAEVVLELLQRSSLFQSSSSEKIDYALDSCGRPETKFEQRGKRLSHDIHDIYVIKQRALK